MRTQAFVSKRLLKFVLKIRQSAQPFYHSGRTGLLGVVHQQAVISINLNVFCVQAAANQPATLLYGKEAVLLGTVLHHQHRHLIKQAGGAFNNV